MICVKNRTIYFGNIGLQVLWPEIFKVISFAIFSSYLLFLLNSLERYSKYSLNGDQIVTEINIICGVY